MAMMEGSEHLEVGGDQTADNLSQYLDSVNQLKLRENYSLGYLLNFTAMAQTNKHAELQLDQR